MPNPDLDAYFSRRGTQTAVAREFGVCKQTVNEWRKKGFVPHRRATAFEKFTGVPREKACPDFQWAKPRRSKQKAEA